jgi:hypothetical protein
VGQAAPPDHPDHQPVRVVTLEGVVIAPGGCQEIRMVLDTASMTVKTTVASQFSATASEGDF